MSSNSWPAACSTKRVNSALPRRSKYTSLICPGIVASSTQRTVQKTCYMRSSLSAKNAALVFFVYHEEYHSRPVSHHRQDLSVRTELTDTVSSVLSELDLWGKNALGWFRCNVHYGNTKHCDTAKTVCRPTCETLDSVSFEACPFLKECNEMFYLRYNSTVRWLSLCHNVSVGIGCVRHHRMEILDTGSSEAGVSDKAK